MVLFNNLTGFMILRSAFRSFSTAGHANASLLETFTKIVRADGQSESSKRSILNRSGVQPAYRFNLKPMESRNTRNIPSNYTGPNLRPGDFYHASDLVAYKEQSAIDGTAEVRRHVDVFRRNKTSALHVHKNVLLMASCLSPTGRILGRNQTKFSAKTQRQVSKSIRRARQMGILPYMSRPQVGMISKF